MTAAASKPAEQAEPDTSAFTQIHVKSWAPVADGRVDVRVRIDVGDPDPVVDLQLTGTYIPDDDGVPIEIVGAPVETLRAIAIALTEAADEVERRGLLGR